jgi:hypothetical protein
MGFGLRFPIFGHAWCSYVGHAFSCFNFQGEEGGYGFFPKQIFPMLLKTYSDIGGGKNKII